MNKSSAEFGFSSLELQALRNHACMYAHTMIVANVVGSFSAGTLHIDSIRMVTDAHISDGQEFALQERWWSNVAGVPRNLWALANWGHMHE